MQLALSVRYRHLVAIDIVAAVKTDGDENMSKRGGGCTGAPGQNATWNSGDLNLRGREWMPQ